MRARFSSFLMLVLLFLVLPLSASADGPLGYYRQPALHGDTLVFVAEGDLWRVPVAGGEAVRLTSHPGDEEDPVISADGKTLAFTAEYEGPREVYTMPLAGGLPVRRTWSSSRYVRTVGFAPNGDLLFATSARTTLPGAQLARIDVSSERVRPPRFLPLDGVSDGSYSADGKTVFFTRYMAQWSHTKRYKGGTAQSVWKLVSGADEAVALTADYPGTSRHPKWHDGRVYFVSDRDGTMNLWSMRPDGGDLKQHTEHDGWDVGEPSLDDGRIAYRVGADLWIYDIASDTSRKIPVTLRSDLDQTREHWVEAPMDYLTAAHVSADGSRVALTARGQVFVVPRHQGRLTEASRGARVRYRDARFMPEGESLLVLSDASGEVELWDVPANGVGDGRQLTDDGEILRWEAVPSPDGRYIAHTDKLQRLFVYDTRRKKNRQIDASEIDRITDLSWSPDGKWLAYVVPADNLFRRIKLMHVRSGTSVVVTTDRFDSYSPAWSADGKWLYFLSDRHLESVVPSPWGAYAPQPFLDKKTEIFALALLPDERFPFAPDDELHEEEGKDEKKNGDEGDDGKKKKSKAPKVRIEMDGLASRLHRVPVDPGNYGALATHGKALYFLSQAAGASNADLQVLPIKNREADVGTLISGVNGYELSGNRKAVLVFKDKTLYVLDAKSEASKPVSSEELGKSALDLSSWKLALVPREEWEQMFVDAWRLERDYFYDRDMHGVSWSAMRKKYEPLVARVTTRAELSDLVAQMVSELSALHTFVYGGEMRRGPDHIEVASLGARLVRDADAGGWRVAHIYASDPDHPGELGPLAQPDVAVGEGDVITRINGEPTLQAPALGALLRNQVGRQVLLHVKSGRRKERPVIVTPVSESAAADLRYDEWEYTRRQRVEKQGGGDLGYVHLRAMGGGNFTEWAESYYPVFNRKGLIIDVRHNRGGNIDSWILGRLLRKVWMYWTQPVGKAAFWNMQYGFRGHVVVLCDAFTASDGEAFSEGFKRLGIGKVIGTRTWGGEIWLSSSNRLRDGGIATAAEYGVYGPEGEWLIEGHGVEPDIVVDNPPHGAFLGRDAQLDAAIEYLQKQIEQEPVPPPHQPPFPDKSVPGNR